MKAAKQILGAVFAGCMLLSPAAPVMAAGKTNITSIEQSTKLNVPVVFKEDVKSEKISLASARSQDIKKYTQADLVALGIGGMARVRVDGKMINIEQKCLAISDEEKDKLKKEQEKDAEDQEKREEAQKKVKASSGKSSEDSEDDFDEENGDIPTIDEIELESLNVSGANTYSYSGSVLTPSAGVNQGPSGKETYYNLPMEGVVAIMRSIGNNDEYWVRDDGVKMLGDYVMVAAHLPTRPRGSLIPTSLGMGIVCDTGTFALSDHTQLDIAVNW